jgi:hypothetical protein
MRPLCIGISPDGFLRTRLPLGRKEANYELNMYVEVRDNEDGMVVYQLPADIVVAPNVSALLRQLEELFHIDDNWRPSILLKQITRPILMQQGIEILSSILTLINDDSFSIQVSLL